MKAALFLGYGLACYGDIRSSSELCERLGEVAFFDIVLRPLYDGVHEIGKRFPVPRNWQSVGPKWIGDGFLFLLLTRASNPSMKEKMGTLELFCRWFRAAGDAVACNYRDCGHTADTPNQIALGITEGPIFGFDYPPIVGSPEFPEDSTVEYVSRAINWAAKLSKSRMARQAKNKFTWMIAVRQASCCATKAELSAWFRKEVSLRRKPEPHCFVNLDFPTNLRHASPKQWNGHA